MRLITRDITRRAALRKVVKRAGAQGLPILKSAAGERLIVALDLALERKYEAELQSAQAALKQLRLRRPRYANLYHCDEPYVADLPSQASQWQIAHLSKLGIRFVDDGTLNEWLGKPLAALPPNLSSVASAVGVFDVSNLDLSLEGILSLLGEEWSSLVALYRLAAFEHENVQDSWVWKFLDLLGHNRGTRVVISQMRGHCIHGNGDFAVGVGAVLDYGLCRVEEALGAGMRPQVSVRSGIENKAWLAGLLEDYFGQLGAELLSLRIGSGYWVRLIVTIGPLFYFLYGELSMTYCFAFDNGLKPGTQVFHYVGPLDMRDPADRLVIFTVLYTDAH